MGGGNSVTQSIRRDSDNFSVDESIQYNEEVETPLNDPTVLEITPQLLETCRSSWTLITHMKRDGETFERGGVNAFCRLFFQNMSNFDGAEIISMFKPRVHTAAANNKNELFVRILDYIVDIPDKSMKIKRKLRCLGRLHAREVGVGLFHFNMFVACLQATIQERMQDKLTHEIEVSWNSLLQFVVDQMTYDNEPIPDKFISKKTGFSRKTSEAIGGGGFSRKNSEATGGGGGFGRNNSDAMGRGGGFSRTNSDALSNKSGNAPVAASFSRRNSDAVAALLHDDGLSALPRLLQSLADLPSQVLGTSSSSKPLNSINNHQLISAMLAGAGAGDEDNDCPPNLDELVQMNKHPGLDQIRQQELDNSVTERLSSSTGPATSSHSVNSSISVSVNSARTANSSNSNTVAIAKLLDEPIPTGSLFGEPSTKSRLPPPSDAVPTQSARLNGAAASSMAGEITRSDNRQLIADEVQDFD